MIAKKATKFNLERKRGLFFQLGLMITGSLTLAAFTYQSPYTLADQGNRVETELISYNTELEEPPKVEPELTQPRMEQLASQVTTVDAENPDLESINEVVNSQTEVNSVVSTSLGKLLIGPETHLSTDIIHIQPDNDVSEFPPVEAVFIGGYVEMQKFISENVQYPDISIQMGDEGTVYVNFIVEKDGSVSNVMLDRGVSAELDREAKRLIRMMPKWKPGESAYGAVRSRVRIPIGFHINK